MPAVWARFFAVSSIRETNGELVEYGSSERPAMAKTEPDECHFIGMAKAHAMERGFPCWLRLA
jgi:hypothetical protein